MAADAGAVAGGASADAAVNDRASASAGGEGPSLTVTAVESDPTANLGCYAVQWDTL